jgi:NAD(P)-dependent dehydrogenase (short-subunit alcohol dehydrogenase family)
MGPYGLSDGVRHDRGDTNLAKFLEQLESVTVEIGKRAAKREREREPAKGGIKLLPRSMAAEWAKHDIQSNAIGPGYIITEMNKALIEEKAFDAWVRGRTPSAHWGTPEDLIGAAVFLASPASDFVNGQILYVDGGMLAVL